MNLWQVLVTLFVACGCFILGRQWGYDGAISDVKGILDRCEELNQNGLHVEIKEVNEDDL